MIPPKTLNFLRASQGLKRFRDCPRLATLPYATYGSAHQITLAAEILSAALYWRSERFRVLNRSSLKRSPPVKSTVSTPVKSVVQAQPIVPVPEVNPPRPAPVLTLVENLGEE